MKNISKHLQVQKDLRLSIVEGVYAIGDILPSENELSEKYGISRMTVRNAMNNLHAEGLIYRQKGRGSFVKIKPKSIELLSIKGFTEIMKGKERDIDTVFVQKPVIQQWNEDFYWNLEENELSADCIYLSRVRSVENNPIMFEKTFLSNSGLSGFCSQDFINKSLFDTLLVNHDIEIKEVVQKFRAVRTTDEIGKYLDLPVGAPVLEIIRKLSTNRAEFFVYSFAYCNTDEFTVET